jgi:hypothetical protein
MLYKAVLICVLYKRFQRGKKRIMHRLLSGFPRDGDKVASHKHNLVLTFNIMLVTLLSPPLLSLYIFLYVELYEYMAVINPCRSFTYFLATIYPLKPVFFWSDEKCCKSPR